jgi:hypothetical protein
LIRSALFLAVDRLLCPEKIRPEPGLAYDPGTKTEEELRLQTKSMVAIELASRQLHSMVMAIVPMIQHAQEDNAHLYALSGLSPFMLDASYAGAATFNWLYGENGYELYRTAGADIEMFLNIVHARWRLGGAYSKIAQMWHVT